jgi:hypothetical protein
MRRLWLAVRVFFGILFNRAMAERIAAVLAEAAPSTALPQPAAPVAASRVEPTRKPVARNEAIALLAALQREARLVDFVMEPLDGYSDAQVGAAARTVHRDCAAVLQRIFALRPLEAAAEGAEIVVAEGFDPARWRLTGNVTGRPPYRGRLCHHGWEAAKVELPEWTGGESAARIIAPAEVELQ